MPAMTDEIRFLTEPLVHSTISQRIIQTCMVFRTMVPDLGLNKYLSYQGMTILIYVVLRKIEPLCYFGFVKTKYGDPWPILESHGCILSPVSMIYPVSNEKFDATCFGELEVTLDYIRSVDEMQSLSLSALSAKTRHEINLYMEMTLEKEFYTGPIFDLAVEGE